VASLKIVNSLGGGMIPITSTVGSVAAAYAKHFGQTTSVQLRAFDDFGVEVSPSPQDVVWTSADKLIADLISPIGLTNSIVFGNRLGETSITVKWISKNVQGTVKAVSIGHTDFVPVGSSPHLGGQTIKIINSQNALLDMKGIGESGNTKVIYG